MKYYARKQGTNDFLGPYSIEELRIELAHGRLTLRDSIIEAKGQSLGQLRRTDGWMLLSNIHQLPTKVSSSTSIDALVPAGVICAMAGGGF